MTSFSQSRSPHSMHRTRLARTRLAALSPGRRVRSLAGFAHRGRRWAVLVLAVGQVVTTAVVFGTGAGALSSDASDPTITPAGYAFAIWTVPLVSCVVFAAYAFRRSGSEPYRSVGWPLAGVMAGFNLWLWFAVENWVWATVVIFAAMLVLLAAALRASQQHPAPTRAGRAVVAVTLGVYAGWTTVAVWANLAAALHGEGSGLPNAAAGWQAAVLVGAAVSGLVGVWTTRGALTYTGAVVWALTAMVVATAGRGAPGLCALAAVAVVLTGAVAVARRRAWHGSRI